jgi:hypothetical protein
MFDISYLTCVVVRAVHCETVKGFKRLGVVVEVKCLSALADSLPVSMLAYTVTYSEIRMLISDSPLSPRNSNSHDVEA